ncbi:hypothetical protein [Kingella potus]|uniref:hypothetical protein n=1 Tax=Kingella potus TaxID=265175 RepID=UPI001FD0B757|nr:hypothetical protein [Kingella potus]UOP01967.1 hypothetical protein LVJ84_13270 [Kingella potus]
MGLSLAAAAVPLRATREDRTTADNSFIFYILTKYEFRKCRPPDIAVRAESAGILKLFPLKSLTVSDNFCKAKQAAAGRPKIRTGSRRLLKIRKAV